MKDVQYRVNLGSSVSPKYSLFKNLVEAKKAIREKLLTIDKRAKVESSVSRIERNVYGLGYRYNVGSRTSTQGIYRIDMVKE